MLFDQNVMAWLFENVPGYLRLLLALVLFVGITVFIVWRFHDRIVALADGDPWPPEDKDEEEDEESDAAGSTKKAKRTDSDEDAETAILAETGESGELSSDDDGSERAITKKDEETSDEPTDERDDDDDRGPKKPPKPFYLAGRIMAITMTAFVFLLAFTLNNFWGNAQDARVAVEEESGDFQTMVIAAESLPDSPEKDQVKAALRSYGETVVQQEWPLLVQADSVQALLLHRKVGRELADATVLADVPGEVSNAAGWGTITSSVPTMLQEGSDRIHQLPRSQAPGVIALIFLLAIMNLALTAAYQPAPLVQNVVLMGFMAGIIALLLFILVEASNPFAGAGGLLPTAYMVP